MPKGFIGANGSATALSNEQKQALKDFLGEEAVDAEIEEFLNDLEEEDLEEQQEVENEITEVLEEVIPDPIPQVKSPN